MSYRYLRIVLLGLGLQALPAHAESTSAGLTGLGEMRTPETLTGSRSQFTLSGRYSLLEEPLGKRIAPALGYTQGLGDHAEAGIQLPFLMHEGDSGPGNIPVAGKYQFVDWSGLQVAGIGWLALPTAPKGKAYGTGKTGFGGEFTAMLTRGPIAVMTSIGYGKSDYCRRCTLVGQQVQKPSFLPVLELAEGVSISWAETMAFAEVHFKTVSTGIKSGFLQGDPDVYALLGARTALPGNFSVTGYGGLGVPRSSANTQNTAALLLHYTIGEKPPAAPSEPAAAAKTGPLLRVDVVNGCSNAVSAGLILALLQDKYDARVAGKLAKPADATTVSYAGNDPAVAHELERLIPGTQRLSQVKSLPAGVAARVITGCDLGALVPKAPAKAVVKPAVPRPPPAVKAAPAVPLAPKKPKDQMNVAVVNSCSRAGLAEETATVLIVDGYNVTRIADDPKPANAAATVLRFRAQYKEEAATLARKLAGTKQFLADDTLPADADILVTVGCGQ